MCYFVPRALCSRSAGTCGVRFGAFVNFAGWVWVAGALVLMLLTHSANDAAWTALYKYGVWAFYGGYAALITSGAVRFGGWSCCRRGKSCG